MNHILLEMQKLNGNEKATLPLNTGIQIPPTQIQKMGMPMVQAFFIAQDPVKALNIIIVNGL